MLERRPKEHWRRARSVIATKRLPPLPEKGSPKPTPAERPGQVKSLGVKKAVNDTLPVAYPAGVAIAGWDSTREIEEP